MTRTTRHDSSVPRWCWPAAVVLVGALLVGGCTGGEPEVEESQLPLPASVTASPSASASDEPSAEASPEASGAADAGEPERPAAMDKKDADGAAAAAEYFLALYDHALKTGKTDALKKMSHRACGFCDDTLQEASTIADEKQTYEGGELAGVLVRAYKRDAVTGIYPLDMDVTQAPAKITESDGTVTWRQDRVITEARIEMGLRDGEWVVVEIAGRPQ